MRGIKETLSRWHRSLNGKYFHPGYESRLPEYINIETASVCNLRCSCCPHGVAASSMRKPGIMSTDTFHKVLSHIDIPLKLSYLHLHGEPFLNPNLPDFTSELTGRKIGVNLYTNSIVIDESQLDAILDAKRVVVNISADLLGKDYYESIRVGAHYDEVLSKLDSVNAVFARHKMFFNIITVTDDGNVDSVDAITGYCEQLYERYSQLNGILLGSKFPWPRLPHTGDLAGHIKRSSGRCTHAFEGLSVLWNGDATMCSFDYTGECVVGSLVEHTYSEVFNNEAARRFRKLHWRHKDAGLPLCKDCLLDRYVPSSVTLHRASFLKSDNDEKRRKVGSFFRFG